MAQRKTTAKKASVKSAPKKQTGSKSRSAGRKPAKSTRGRRSAPKKTYEDSSMTDEIISLIVKSLITRWEVGFLTSEFMRQTFLLG